MIKNVKELKYHGAMLEVSWSWLTMGACQGRDHLFPEGRVKGSQRWVVMYTLHVCVLWCVQFFAIPWTTAHQAPLFMGFSRQEPWSG